MTRQQLSDEELAEIRSMVGPQAWHGLALGPGTALALLAALYIWEPGPYLFMGLGWVMILHFFSLLYAISLLRVIRRARTWPGCVLIGYWLLLIMFLPVLFVSGRTA